MTPSAAATLPDDRQLLALEEKFDPEMRFRPSVPPATYLIAALLIALSCFHFYTAGFGLLRGEVGPGARLVDHAIAATVILGPASALGKTGAGV